jgi:hypothetical protein
MMRMARRFAIMIPRRGSIRELLRGDLHTVLLGHYLHFLRIQENDIATRDKSGGRLVTGVQAQSYVISSGKLGVKSIVSR